MDRRTPTKSVISSYHTQYNKE